MNNEPEMFPVGSNFKNVMRCLDTMTHTNIISAVIALEKHSLEPLPECDDVYFEDN